MPSYASRQSVTKTIGSLHEAFGRNITNVSQSEVELFDDLDLNSRTIAEIRTVLLRDYCTTDEQKKICADILDEVFSDFTLALYLFSAGLIVPARMSIRRALELGLASVYLWDLPHEYWGWKKHDVDLSFSAMITHLNCEGYRAYLASIHGAPAVSPICDFPRLQRFYRQLSNTVHGKTEALQPLSPERFTAGKNDLKTHLNLAIEVQGELIALLYGRFHGLKANIDQSFPQVGRQKQ
jgi:hypothetical protein